MIIKLTYHFFFKDTSIGFASLLKYLYLFFFNSRFSLNNLKYLLFTILEMFFVDDMPATIGENFLNEKNFCIF